MPKSCLDTGNLPFCKGCSHHLIARSTARALEKLGVDPLDVVIVTDIGCHGIIDGSFSTHTVHGLHGRSIALAAGISAALSDPKKKIIVFIGDGGSTIGMNHLIGAAHRNFDITVVLHNNMLYGMTGGQRSDLTPGAFRTRSPIEGFTEEPLDLLKIARDAGAACVSRIAAKGDFSEALADAIAVEGFSLVEVLEICPSYGVKQNREVSLSDMAEKFGLPLETHLNETAKRADFSVRRGIPSLFDSLKPIHTERGHSLDRQFTLVLGGSAGEGVQVAADIFAAAAMSCGLNVTKKGSYPVTVGIGFSASEIILSPGEIVFTGMTKIDWALVSSMDGMSYLKKHIEAMEGGTVLADSGNPVPATGASVLSGDFRGAAGSKEVNLLMMMALLEVSGIFPAEALVDAISRSRIGEKTDTAALLEKARVISASRM